jgi:hypothetical protein
VIVSVRWHQNKQNGQKSQPHWCKRDRERENDKRERGREREREREEGRDWSEK